MTVYTVVSDGKVVQMFWSMYRLDAKQAADALVCKLTTEQHLAQVVEQHVTVV